eukprot:6187941-Pleurochrysis_carterae.AAC.1
MVAVKYTEGGRECMQVWTYETPEAVKEDARTQPRFKPSINCANSELRTPYATFINAAMPPKMLEGLV